MRQEHISSPTVSGRIKILWSVFLVHFMPKFAPFRLLNDELFPVFIVR